MRAAKSRVPLPRCAVCYCAAPPRETIFSDWINFWYSAVRDNGRLREPEASMDAMELRPLSTGEILDRTFTLYRRNFLLFLGISAIPHALVLVLNLVRVSLTFSSSSLTRVTMHPGGAVTTTPPGMPSISGLVSVAVIGLLTV